MPLLFPGWYEFEEGDYQIKRERHQRRFFNACAIDPSPRELVRMLCDHNCHDGLRGLLLDDGGIAWWPDYYGSHDMGASFLGIADRRDERGYIIRESQIELNICQNNRYAYFVGFDGVSLDRLLAHPTLEGYVTEDGCLGYRGRKFLFENQRARLGPRPK